MPEYTEVEVLMLKGDKGDAGATEWGGIAGEISDNNELQAALDKKADVESLKTVAISGKFPDLLEKPTTLRGYGVEPQTAYNEIKDLVKPNFSSLQGSPAENYNLKRELDNKTNVAQFNKLNSDVSTLKSAVNTKAATTALNDLSNKVDNKADKSDIRTINSTLASKAEKYEINNINKRLNAINNSIDSINSVLRSIKGRSHFDLGQKRESFLAAHPLGSLFYTFESGNPRDLYGGECGYWELIKGRVVVAVDANDTDFCTAGLTGGEKTHTLTTSEMPSHQHTYNTPPCKIFYPASGGSELLRAIAGTYIHDNTYPTGGNQPHNNMPPFIAAYVWRRTG